MIICNPQPSNVYRCHWLFTMGKALLRFTCLQSFLGRSSLFWIALPSSKLFWLVTGWSTLHNVWLTNLLKRNSLLDFNIKWNKLYYKVAWLWCIIKYGKAVYCTVEQVLQTGVIITMQGSTTFMLCILYK